MQFITFKTQPWQRKLTWTYTTLSTASVCYCIGDIRLCIPHMPKRIARHHPFVESRFCLQHLGDSIRI
ncbi:hypothetical protein CEXT_156121 [Caerostris extrusa]|uniref:Uncharacterized protein n=1 Tax=Caerostris extrusa TaxID=172846 RepID=A0AAV4NIB4_CAEEX|nr:hypothetical protein CEXT_156121 [Caerostris extrusa]